MMPVIRIPDPVFERLQAIAKPFVDTPASVIEKLLDFYYSHQTEVQEVLAKPRPLVTVTQDFDPHNPPSLTHTRRVEGKVGGLQAEGWNELVQMTHRQATKLRDVAWIKRTTRSNIVVGRKEEDGFHYVGDINLSIQNVPADKAWRNALHLAESLKIDISVEFEWPEIDGAAMPGKRGRLLWTPNQP